jgi:magnesium transporter
LRPDTTVEQAIRYLQRQAKEKLETIYYAYVLDQEQRLRGVVSFRDLFAAPGDKPIADIMHTQVVSVPDTMDQESVARVMASHDLNALPVVSPGGRMEGIVTVDDIVDVVQREATEDIHKLGGMEALSAPYFQTRLALMVRKRAGWLSALFLGEMLTASAMGYFEAEIARAVVLALFVPLIISSGGNSGSQASTLIIRAMALGEVSLKDWFLIVRRELATGLALGIILAAIGFIRITAWQRLFHTYGSYYPQVAATVAVSLVGVVMWGTLAGAMLPFVIRKLGFDPASASAPFVATLVDVSGLIIYFSVAQAMLQGTLL